MSKKNKNVSTATATASVVSVDSDTKVDLMVVDVQKNFDRLVFQGLNTLNLEMIEKISFKAGHRALKDATLLNNFVKLSMVVKCAIHIYEIGTASNADEQIAAFYKEYPLFEELKPRISAIVNLYKKLGGKYSGVAFLNPNAVERSFRALSKVMKDLPKFKGQKQKDIMADLTIIVNSSIINRFEKFDLMLAPQGVEEFKSYSLLLQNQEKYLKETLTTLRDNQKKLSVRFNELTSKFFEGSLDDEETKEKLILSAEMSQLSDKITELEATKEVNDINKCLNFYTVERKVSEEPEATTAISTTEKKAVVKAPKEDMSAEDFIVLMKNIADQTLEIAKKYTEQKVFNAYALGVASTIFLEASDELSDGQEKYIPKMDATLRAGLQAQAKSIQNSLEDAELEKDADMDDVE